MNDGSIQPTNQHSPSEEEDHFLKKGIPFPGESGRTGSLRKFEEKETMFTDRKYKNLYSC